MAEIDKVLPNVEQTIKIPSQEEIEIDVAEDQEKKQSANPVDVQENDDGSVDVNFQPGLVNPGEDEGHFANLADLLDDSILSPLGHELYDNYSDYKNSRKDWEKAYREGLELLGFKYEQSTEPFKGASGATHPVLAEAVTQFQAQAYKELLPAGGPVRTQMVGMPTPEKEQQAIRVKDYLNYQIMTEMKEYEAEFDQMLFYLPLSGSAFKKVYYDDIHQRTVSKFVPADDLIVPYTATSLDDAESIIHVVKMSENDLRKQQVAGFYRDIELTPGQDHESETEKKERELEGRTKGRDQKLFTLLECHVDLDLLGFEDMSPEQEPTGIKLPYIVTIEEASKEVLSIRRNYEIGDKMKAKIQYFVHFKFLPGLGFYGFGLIHMIGGLSRTATMALRSLLDAGTLSNMPAGFKMRGIRIKDEAQPIQPGEFKDVDAPGGSIRDAFMPLPFKEPSATLFNLMGNVVQAGQRFAAIADTQVGDGNQGAAVGTTVALLERGSRVMSAVHKRMYASMKQEFTLMARVCKLYLPPVYPYDVVGGQKQIKQTDFDDKIDILPVADPNIFSQTQRISLAQTQMQLAASNPQIHNQYEVFRNMYEALGAKDVDLILKKPEKPIPKDPALEHIDALSGKPFQAFPGQDHRAHMTAHLNFMATSMVKNAPMISAAIHKNCLEHISLMGQEQIELEFREELGQLQQMIQMMQNPQAMQQNPNMQNQIQMLQQKIEARKAILIAELTEDFMNEEKKINGDYGNDPIAQLRARELDLQAQENQRRETEGQERLNLDKMKAMMSDQNQDQKLEQNEQLANLRAETSIEKTLLQSALKDDKTPNSVSIIRKGN